MFNIDMLFKDNNAGAPSVTQERHGVALEYVAYKLREAVMSSHKLLHQCWALNKETELAFPLALTAQSGFCEAVYAYLGLYNMLAAAADALQLAELIIKSPEELAAWLEFVAKNGSVIGLHREYSGFGDKQG